MTAPGWYARGPRGISVVDVAVDGDDLVFERDQGEPELRAEVPALVDAADARDAAEGFRDEAEGFRDAAAGSASTASGHASTASTKAGEASDSASDAADVLDAAGGAAGIAAARDAAEGFRDEAEGFRDSAEGFKNAAGSSALAASNSASDAANAVASAVAALVDSAPEALDTLAEIATALGNDPNFATTITNALAGKQGKIIVGTCETGNTTAAKEVTAASNPVAGDVLAVIFTGGNNVNYHTLDVNSAGAATVFIAGRQPGSGESLATTSGILFYLFDGTYFHMLGTSQNTQYGEISEAEINAGTAATGRAITARRITYLLAKAALKADTSTAGYGFVVDEDDMASNSATKVPTQQSVKAYVDSGRVQAYANGTLTARSFDVLNETQWDAVSSPVSGRIYLVFED